MAIHSDMQGPAPDGFHIPSKDEWVALCGILTSTFSMASNATTMGTYLKMPMAGYRYYNNASVESVGSYTIYWSSSTPAYATSAYMLEFNSSSISPQNYTNRASGLSIRCFKDTPVIPTSSWTTLYDGSSIATGAGVFWNSTGGLISVSGDGQTWYTIMDKNLGATTVYNQGDAHTDENCGSFYQWGNNYGFPHSGDVVTSSTQVDASNYGPGNYYNSSTFITRSLDRSSVQNDDLWGGVSQGTWGTPDMKLHGHIGTWHMEWVPEAKDYSAMRGPAPSGFHVPLKTERQAVKDIRTALGGGSSDGTNFGIALKLPFAGRRYFDGADVGNQGSTGYYRSSTRSNVNSAYRMYFDSSAINPQFTDVRSYGFSVRCFKNSPVIPTSSWTKLYGTSIEAGGIFWSSTDGLISLSSDGQTWVTIADKNLGATTVWNSGDTLSEANCGYYYQRGNNYGFPRTGTIANQSTTRVDASNYGPGNYYSSDTFIKYSGRWDSTDNGNLWGGVTGIIITPGHYRPRQPVVLKTYEEIVAMATAEGRPWTNTIAELNTNVEGYFNILNEGNHLSIGTPKVPEQSGYYINGITSSGYYIRKDISGPLDHNGLWYYEIEE